MRLKNLSDKLRNTEYRSVIISCILIYITIYMVALQVPMHADDYDYYHIGLSLKSHIKHYLNWSGRFIVDYTSSILLNCFNRPIYMAINSLVLLIVIVLASVIPSVVLENKLINRNTKYILWLNYMLYWISNPNLGETSFWLVGSSNYLWTLMWAGLYILYLLHSIKTESERYRSYKLFLLGIFAGLSNEGIGSTIVILTIVILLSAPKDKRKVALTGLVATSIGCALLVLSPGNSERLEHFNDWSSLTLFEKVLTHVTNRVPDALSMFYYVYIVMIISLIFALCFKLYNDSMNQSCRYSILFILSAFCSVLVFVVSPIMPGRTLNAFLFFMLLSSSFILNAFNGSKKSILAYCCVLGICAIPFILSYRYMLYAYKQTNIQSKIREDIIQEAKANNETEAVIPDWYFTHLAKESDRFSSYRSTEMPGYYGLDDITWQDTIFNYAILTRVEPVSVNMRMDDDLMLENIYTEFNAPYEQTIVFEFNKGLDKYVQNGDTVLFVHLRVKDRDRFVNADIPLQYDIVIGDKHLYGKTIFTPNLSKLERIDFGIYDTNTKKNIAKYSIDFSQLENANN